MSGIPDDPSGLFNLLEKELLYIHVSYNFLFKLFQLKKYLPHDCVVVNEGANTMDIGRTMIPNHLPRKRYAYASFFTA